MRKGEVMTDWKKVADRDRQLRENVDKSSTALARFRYEQTIGAGVSFSEYARRCGLRETPVRVYASAWKEIRQTSVELPIDVALVRARNSADRADVIEAVAEARGMKVGTVDRHRRDEVTRIEQTARDRAEKRGTTVREEAKTIATMTVRREKTDKTQRAARREKADLRFIEVEALLLKGRRALEDAVRVDADFDEEHRDLIRHAIGLVRQALSLIEMKFVDAASVDWDAELAKLDGGQR